MSAVTQFRTRRETMVTRPPESSSAARGLESTCAKCNLRETCLSGGLPAEDLERGEEIVFARRRILRGEHLFNAGDEFTCVYAISGGFFKTSIADREGRAQVTGFFMGGELLGMDGLASDRHKDSAIALEDSNVCAMPYSVIEEMSREVPTLQRRLHSVLAREIVRGHGIMMLLGTMSGEQRLAAFLLNLSKRFLHRGYSGSRFVLRMTRDEIGNYLGLKPETVSRLFSKFHEHRLIEIDKKQVSIVDLRGLQRTLAPGG